MSEYPMLRQMAEGAIYDPQQHAHRCPAEQVARQAPAVIVSGTDYSVVMREIQTLLAERDEAIEMLKESLLYIPNIGANTRGARCAPAVRSLRGRIMAFLDTAHGVRRGFN